MRIDNLFARLLHTLHEFRSSRDGNVAIIFALTMLPIIGSIGAAIDYSRANYVKADMQTKLDAVALMLSKEATTDTSNQLQTNASKYFLAMFNPSEAQNTAISVTYSSSGGSSLVVNSSTSVPTTFAAVLGINTINLSATSTVRWGMSRLRVALVLDNTGSMAQSGKMTALQSATNNLLSQLNSAAQTNGDVYVSIIPFVKDVNLDHSNWNSNWIYWDDAAKTDTKSWDANNGTCSASGASTRSACLQLPSCSLSGYTSQSSCTGAGTCSNGAEKTQNSCTGNKACSKSQYTSKNSCTSNGGTWAFGKWTAGVWSTATWTPNAHNTWNGCVVDRGGANAPDPANYDTNVVATTTSIMATLFSAEQYSSCPQPAMGLSYNWSAMSSLVNNMSPNGNTNQAIGLAAGWMSLVGGGPFTEPAMASGYTYTQVIILLTDGLNTEDRWYTNQSSIDARQQMTCNNIKAAGITLYTIQVNTGGDPTSTLLQNCASSSDKFYLLTSASQIVTVFNTIGTNLTQLYVAK